MSQELLINDMQIMAKAELDVQIATAKAYPRDIKTFMARATELACMDEQTAQSCFYVLPRKDKDGTRKEIKGASIRLAEIVANCYGNLHAATKIIGNDGNHITASAVAWNLQDNVKIEVQNKVSIRFGEKNGTGGYTANADMQTMLSNAASAKALRNAIFKVVPKALVDRVLEQAMTFSVGDAKTVNSKVHEVFDKLVKMGLDKQQILDYYERKSLAEITVEDLRSLVGIGTAIKEKMIKIEDVFCVEKDEANPMTAAERVNDLLANKSAPLDLKAQKSTTIDADTGEIIN